jgi:hypothetical protein
MRTSIRPKESKPVILPSPEGTVDLTPKPIERQIDKYRRQDTRDRVATKANVAVEYVGSRFRSLLNTLSIMETPPADRQTNRRAGRTAIGLMGSAVVLFAGGVAYEASQTESPTCVEITLDELGQQLDQTPENINLAATTYSNQFDGATSSSAFDFAQQSLNDNGFIEVCSNDQAFQTAQKLDRN